MKIFSTDHSLIFIYAINLIVYLPLVANKWLMDSPVILDRGSLLIKFCNKSLKESSAPCGKETSEFMILSNKSILFPEEKGGFPNFTQYNVAPTEYQSDSLPSYPVNPSTTSGEANAGVPMNSFTNSPFSFICDNPKSESCSSSSSLICSKHSNF